MAERGILLVQPEHVASLKLMSVQEQIRKIHPLTGHQETIYKHIKMASSLKSVRMDKYILMIVDSADLLNHRYRETAMWAASFDC